MFSFCQTESKTNYLLKENRKGQLFFKLSSEYRITPLPTNVAQNPNIPVDSDMQNSGVAFAYTLDFFTGKNLSIGFSNSFRYDELGANLGSNRNQIEGGFGVEPTNRGLIIGFIFI